MKINQPGIRQSQPLSETPPTPRTNTPQKPQTETIRPTKLIKHSNASRNLPGMVPQASDGNSLVMVQGYRLVKSNPKSNMLIALDSNGKISEVPVLEIPVKSKEGRQEAGGHTSFINNVSMYVFKAPLGKPLYRGDAANIKGKGNILGGSGTTAGHIWALTKAGIMKGVNKLSVKVNKNPQESEADVVDLTPYSEKMNGTPAQGTTAIVRMYGKDLRSWFLGKLKMGKNHPHTPEVSKTNLKASVNGYKKIIDKEVKGTNKEILSMLNKIQKKQGAPGEQRKLLEGPKCAKLRKMFGGDKSEDFINFKEKLISGAVVQTDVMEKLLKSENVLFDLVKVHKMSAHQIFATIPIPGPGAFGGQAHLCALMGVTANKVMIEYAKSKGVQINTELLNVETATSNFGDLIQKALDLDLPTLRKRVDLALLDDVFKGDEEQMKQFNESLLEKNLSGKALELDQITKSDTLKDKMLGAPTLTLNGILNELGVRIIPKPLPKPPSLQDKPKN